MISDPPNIPADLLELAAGQGLELRPRLRAGMPEPCALGYTQPGEDWLSERTGESWEEVFRLTKAALVARQCSGGRWAAEPQGGEGA